MANLDDLNARAQYRFQALKEKKGWTVERIQALQPKNHVSSKVDTKRIENMIEVVEQQVVINDELHTETVSSLEFIESLNLPSNLSIAIGFIIAAKDKDKRENLKKAIDYLNQEI